MADMYTQGFEDGQRSMREAAYNIANEHDVPVKPLKSPPGYDDSMRDEVLAEQRGERIAARIIAVNIAALPVNEPE
jgi:hypothetical protein